MKTDIEIKKLVDEVFKNYSATEKKKLIKILSIENRVNTLKDNISIQEDIFDVIEPLAKCESQKKINSLESRKFKQRIIKEALQMIFNEKPKTKKTLGAVWKEFYLLKDRDVCDPLTGIKIKIYKKGDTLFVKTDNQMKPFEYKKRSLQRYINDLK
jgi:hypothetical protein